ncbi:MAG: O-antigen ligase family protein [Synergistaceae bacterium]|nr:O-antigen ligase family protein [Synergistaceae bacterium]
MYVAFFISFSLPNLVFSGKYWFDTLHLMKWFVTMVPVGALALFAGTCAAVFGAKRMNFKLDPFGALWLLLLLLVTVQPLFIGLSSISTYAKEWFYFAALFAVYILAYNLWRDGRFHRVLLWGSSVNAAVNVLFAEILIRGSNGGVPFIMDVPGNYIGNTAQQEMFGLWMAMAILNSFFLHIHYAGEWRSASNENPEPDLGRMTASSRFGGVASRLLLFANLFLLSVNAWGLWNSTTRGAILSLLVAIAVLIVCFWRNGEKLELRHSLILSGVVAVLLVVVLGASALFGVGRAASLISKVADMLQNTGTFGGRISIWRTSMEVYRKEPLTGVGLGQYKWHFLDGQRLLYKNHPELAGDPGYNWQYTYWAHSEYLQWLCETGLIGAIMLLLMALWWLYEFSSALVRRKRLPPEALWGCSMLFLLWFDAIFSRPFHRIENSVWMALAFALANRHVLPGRTKWADIDSEFLYRCFGGLVAVAAVAGFVFIGGGMAGDKMIYRALVLPSGVQTKFHLLNSAERYLMSRDDAREQMAELNIAIGSQQRDMKAYSKGLNDLYVAFSRRPTAKLLFEVIDHARKLNDMQILQRAAVYLHPDSLSVREPPDEAASK